MFIETPATKRSISCRRLVYGVGINDAKYITQVNTRQRRTTCPFYKRWLDMLKRCYSDVYQINRPTYIGCTVCDEWLLFSNFRTWMKGQDWQGRELDKDIIKPSNKIYSPEGCCFVSRALNSLLINSVTHRGRYPRGVCFNKVNRKYIANISIDNKRVHIGCYQTASDASRAYLIAKSHEIIRYAAVEKDKRVADGLLKHLALLK